MGELTGAFEVEEQSDGEDEAGANEEGAQEEGDGHLGAPQVLEKGCHCSSVGCEINFFVAKVSTLHHVRPGNGKAFISAPNAAAGPILIPVPVAA